MNHVCRQEGLKHEVASKVANSQSNISQLLQVALLKYGMIELQMKKPEERKARKNRNKSSTQAARRCKTRASVAPDVHDAELAMRREIRASIAPDVHHAELAMRREIRASVAPEVHDAELAARRAAYKNEPLEIRAAKLQKRRENRPKIQVRLICSNFSVSEYNIFFAFLATLASKEY